MDAMQLANSLPLWLACGTAVLLVVFQAVIFTKKAMDAAPKVGLTNDQVKRAMKSSALTSLGPSVVILSGMLSLLVSVGGPMAWMRLSFIGSVMFESIAAGIGTASAGVQLGVDEMTTFAFTMAVWTMILGSIGWIIVSTLTADKMEKVQNRMAGGNSALVGVISGAAMVGAFGGMVSQKLVAVDKSALSCVLGAARLLKAHEDELEGQVKLMFQPAEETMDGAKMMVENGILKDPDVNAALGIHVFTNLPLPAGTVIMTGADSKMAAVDWFTIKITGKGCHGAQPNNGVDPLNVMSHIHLALQAINAREMDPADNMVLTIGQMHGGNTSNVIPQEAMMSGTIRTLKNTTREMVKTRMDAIVSTVAAAFNAEAHVEYGSGCPVLFHNQELYGEVKGYIGELEGVHFVDLNDIGQHMSNMGSEDFSYVANEVPTVFLGIAAGQPEQGYCYPQHHPKAMFHEDALPVGAAVYAHVAMEWLKNH